MFGGTAMVFFIPTILGMYFGGMGWWLLGWFVYLFVFFELWENRILCAHCPFYAENGGQGHILHCYANYGLYKTWPYDPGPMSRSHKAQFIIALSIFVGYPIPFLLISEQTLALLIAAIGIVLWLTTLKLKICPHCLNFSCPLNSVPKNLVDAFLKRNPVMRQGWEDCGYQVD